MVIFRSDPIIREVGVSDQTRLAHFLNHTARVHRHLDWKQPLEWLGSQPFLVSEAGGTIQAVFACPPDPPAVAWIRLFGSSGPLSREVYFSQLLSRAQAELSSQPQVTIAAIALSDWFEKILKSSGMKLKQNIVVLEWTGPLMTGPEEKFRGVNIRVMLPEDLPNVYEVDKAAFDPLWHNSLEGLRLAYRQSAWSTVAEVNGKISGYQISTGMSLSGHLARLAVLPEMQSRGIGYAIIHDLLSHFRQEGAWRVTVNTQDDNQHSLALYEKSGFRRTGETFPVYVL